MRIFLLISLFSILSNELFLLDKIASLAERMQKNCAALFPLDFENKKLAQSFVCGTALTDPDKKNVFQKTGLLHLMVVSGSHLHVVSFLVLFMVPKRFQKNFYVRSFRSLSLFAYCLLTGFQPPVVRAFAAHLLSACSFRLRWHWDPGKVQLGSGLLILLLFPRWILSFSFYLSWLASLGFLLIPLSTKNKTSGWEKFVNALVSSALIQAFVAVAFSGFSLFSVFTNALLAPIISLTLFPLSILSILIPQSVPVVDSGWNLLIQFLSVISVFSSDTEPDLVFKTTSSQWIFLWLFLTVIHCFFEFLRQQRYRRSCV